MSDKNVKKYTYSMSEEQNRRIKIAAATQGMKINEYLTNLVKADISNQTPPDGGPT